jgi:nitrite reductase/ring-hydroxylating ferredoxin subunit
MAEYVWAAEAKDLTPNAMLDVRVEEKALLLVSLAGKVYAMSNLCTHLKCFLHNGKLEGKILTCPCHFAEFDVTTGAVLSGPAKLPLPTYPVKIEGNSILVEI